MLDREIMDKYDEWRSFPAHPEEIKADLRAIEGDEAAIEDRFYTDLHFGTGGLRGVLGAGTNRMNIYTVGRTTLGLAKYVASLGEAAKRRGVVVGYDCRHMSREFALEVGLVLAAEGVKAYVFDHLCPTPQLSYAVRHFQAAGGVMITASHNPPEYNGYKVYNEYGGQVLTDDANRITAEIQRVEDLFAIPRAEQSDAERAGLLNWVGSEMDALYCRDVSQALAEFRQPEAARESLRVVYTPLHGTGNIPVRRVLAEAGYAGVHVVPAQAEPDGDFSTVKSPNPEEHAAFELALRLADEVQADIALATDPDADRVGVAVRRETGEYQLFTGNQLGGLLVDFLLGTRKASDRLPENAIVFKTVVTSELGAQVANTYGVAVENTLTGFKYIGERIQTYQESGTYRFQFGYEESYGYLASDIVRDKDAVQICLLACEIAAFYKQQGMTLVDALKQLYERVGYYKEDLVSSTFPGIDGVEKIQSLMERLRGQGVTVPGLTLVGTEDYLNRVKKTFSENSEGMPVGEESITLPKSDVLKYLFAGGSWLAVRPSGTEPKIKFYLAAQGSSEADCEEILRNMHSRVQSILA